ncbi:hypothetical protein O181_095573 [Austropuccinia psidii MF-1]|uniref:ATP-dependent DNA helicase n=1 Tax=Austropuccinia psidii MF-1 TaxID=1389203 RepID=A0A9Q3PBC6_9BASI|nr:hypothetical protein [Austropuccinia psidii MF-1]
MGTLSDDCKFKLPESSIISYPSPQDIQNYCLYLIQQELALLDTGFAQVGIHLILPYFRKFEQYDARKSFCMGIEGKAYKAETLTEEQTTIYNNVLQVIISGSQYLGFIDGPGGSGKTYLLNCLIHKCKEHNMKVESVSASGIAALLLDNGTTAHTEFAIPLTVHKDSVCSWMPKDACSSHLKSVDIIIWDEISMQLNVSIVHSGT